MTDNAKDYVTESVADTASSAWLKSVFGAAFVGDVWNDATESDSVIWKKDPTVYGEAYYTPTHQHQTFPNKKTAWVFDPQSFSDDQVEFIEAAGFHVYKMISSQKRVTSHFLCFHDPYSDGLKQLRELYDSRLMYFRD